MTRKPDYKMMKKVARRRAKGMTFKAIAKQLKQHETSVQRWWRYYIRDEMNNCFARGWFDDGTLTLNVYKGKYSKIHPKLSTKTLGKKHNKK